MLMSQVTQLKNELKASSPKTLFNDVTSRLSELKATVSNIRDGSPLSGKVSSLFLPQHLSQFFADGIICRKGPVVLRFGWRAPD